VDFGRGRQGYAKTASGYDGINAGELCFVCLWLVFCCFLLINSYLIVLVNYTTDDLRITIVYRARCFADEAEKDKYYNIQDQMSLEYILDTLKVLPNIFVCLLLLLLVVVIIIIVIFIMR
jgi:hypothetical protein